MKIRKIINWFKSFNGYTITPRVSQKTTEIEKFVSEWVDKCKLEKELADKNKDVICKYIIEMFPFKQGLKK